MSCGSCNTKSGSPKGCKNNGVCGTDGCNKLNVFDWLTNLDPVGDSSQNIFEVRFKNGRKDYYTNNEIDSLTIGDAVVVESSIGYDLGHITLKGGLIPVQLKKKKIKSAFPEIMIPLVSTEAEIKIMKDLVITTARKVQSEKKTKIDFLVGTMIELPRAAIKANDIAKHAEFFSFGTNDLTQTTFGISRDDSGKFLNDYIENKIFDIDPFVSIDDGVGDLMQIASEKGKKQNKKIKLGICGEHGGDPKSIHLCSKLGLNYVSCSPYRVPIARLAAAQAELKK